MKCKISCKVSGLKNQPPQSRSTSSLDTPLACEPRLTMSTVRPAQVNLAIGPSRKDAQNEVTCSDGVAGVPRAAQMLSPRITPAYGTCPGVTGDIECWYNEKSFHPCRAPVPYTEVPRGSIRGERVKELGTFRARIIFGAMLLDRRYKVCIITQGLFLFSTCCIQAPG